jgi:hypothetical protein
MKKYLLFFACTACFYITGNSEPVTGNLVIKVGEPGRFSTILTIYQSSADDGGNLIEYPEAYNYVTPNTTVWLFVTYPSGTPSWSHQGGTASSGQWNSYLGAWEFYMPSGGFGIFQVSVGGQTAMYTILATDYLNTSVDAAPVIDLFEDVKESNQQGVNLLPANSVYGSGFIINDMAVLQRNFRQQRKQ